MSASESTSARSGDAAGAAPSVAADPGSASADGAGSSEATPRSGGHGPRASTAARVAAAAALIAAIAVVLVLVFGNRSSYTVHADFENASGLVDGDNVLIGPAAVGTVSSIGLTRDGQARLTLHLHGTGRLHQGTYARIYEDSLSGIASHYVELEPGPSGSAAIPSGGTIGAGHTFSEVNIDELFDAFDPATRRGLSNLIRGEATSLRGKGRLAAATLHYLAPGLQATSAVAEELRRDEPAFDGLLVQGAQAMRTLAARSGQLTSLIANTSRATGAIASESGALRQTLGLLPGTLSRSTTTLAGLDTTLDALDPVVAAAKPAARRLPAFAASLRAFAQEAAPTVAELDDLLVNPSGAGSLTSLARAAPGLTTAAERAYPVLERNFTESRPQVDYLREYTPDVVAALANVGQAGAYYDADGHYVRTQPDSFPFALGAGNQLVSVNPAQRYEGLTRVTSRCPGAAVQPAPDGSTPRATPGCSTTAVPPGP